MEGLLDPAASDAAEDVVSWGASISRTAGSSTIESQLQHTGATLIAVCDAKLLSKIAQLPKVAAVVQLDVVDTKANVVQEAGTEDVGPVDDFIVNRRV